MKKVFFFIALFLPTAMLCQNSSKVIPGYLGKKWVIGYTLNFMPSLITGFPGANTDYEEFREEGRGFYVNTQHKFSIERVIGRKFSLVGTVLLTKNQAEIDGSTSSVQDFVNIKTRGYILTVRQYRKHLAPISRYFDYKIGYYNITPQDFSYNTTDIENDTTTSRTISAGSTGDLYLGFGWGNSRVIKDRVIFSFGFELGLLVGGMVDALDNSTRFRSIDVNTPNSIENHDTLQSLARERMFFESLMHFTVRIGFMP